MKNFKAVVVGNSVVITGTETDSTTTGFNVYRSQVSGGPYTKINSALIPPAASAPQLSYADTTVQPGQTYYYVATAVNVVGESPYSNEISKTIPPAQTFTISTQPAGESLAFGMTAGGPSPVSQTIAVIAAPATPLPITVSTDQPWLSVSADSPTTKANLTVTVNPAGLAPGTYQGNVIVTNTDGTASNSPFKIAVTLTITGTVPPPPVIS